MRLVSRRCSIPAVSLGRIERPQPSFVDWALGPPAGRWSRRRESNPRTPASEAGTWFRQGGVRKKGQAQERLQRSTSPCGGHPLAVSQQLLQAATETSGDGPEWCARSESDRGNRFRSPMLGATQTSADGEPAENRTRLLRFCRPSPSPEGSSSQSDRRESNAGDSPWQGDAVPLGHGRMERAARFELASSAWKAGP
jgi:hypothetical protein